MTRLYWLPAHPDFRAALEAFDASTVSVPEKLDLLRDLSTYDLDFVQTANLDRRLTPLVDTQPANSQGPSLLRLAILSSCTVDQLLPSIRIAALRHGVPVALYVAPYNLYRQQLLDPSSELYRFRPDVVLFSLDPSAVYTDFPLQASSDAVNSVLMGKIQELRALWESASKGLQATLIHETIVVPPERILGEMDAAMPATRLSFLRRFNDHLAEEAVKRSVLILDTDHLASNVGKDNWCNEPLWLYAKQAVSPAYAPLYADHLARLMAAARGRSYKCLALDLDNTLWGGVIGDDGLEGIELGEGTARGEAFLHFQTYVKRLSERGVLLAVCSKNDRDTALSVFKEHPEMQLRFEDFAAFVANWDNKASNLETIARELNIGTDSIVFFDDNPAERKLVRQFLPQVAVPEISDEPADYARTLSDAGYFEAIRLTQEDTERAAQYRASTQLKELQKGYHDLDSFLASLKMVMDVCPFDPLGRPRITQLINKSNQFNLTTRRYTEEEIRGLEHRADALTLQVRLGDVCGDNGMISVLIATPSADERQALNLDTWLMSCRVLGRQVEEEVLNVLVEVARQRGFTRLLGEYIPTPKNGLVRDHYQKLGFKPAAPGTDGRTLWELDLSSYKHRPTRITSHYMETAA